jgi:RNA polymerase sigma-70 factor (ECF subfamily)
MNESHAIDLCIRHKDPVGFEFLVKKYKKLAYWGAFSILQNREDAYDACQESFEKAFKTIPTLKNLDRFYPWFYVILKHTCLNMASRQKTKIKHIPSIQYQHVIHREKNADHIISLYQENRQVIKVLGLIKSEFREILMLKYFEELTYHEIAKKLNLSKGTVMSRLYYAKKAFAQKYRGGSHE